MTEVQVVRHRSRSSRAADPATTEPKADRRTIEIRARDLAITWRLTEELKPAQRNARTHSDKQIAQIKASIQHFGFNDPIAVDPEGRIIEGHGRLLAAKEIGLTHVPTITLGHMTEAQKRAYIIAHNKIATKAGWNEELLAQELQYLSEADVEFEVEATGFEMAEIDLMIDGLDAEDPEDEVPEVEAETTPVSRLGDLWLLGPHRVLCGNALEEQAYRRLMDGKSAQMSITDSPWNVPTAGHIGGNGRIKHREFVMAAGEMSEAEFTTFLTTAFKHIAANCDDGAIISAFMDWRHISEIIAAGRVAFTELKNLIVWVKDNAGLGSFYRSQHELLFVFKHGTAPHQNHFGLGDTGRYRTNVWQYAGANSFRRGRLEDLAAHPTVKPVALVADAIRDCSRRKEIILDPFLGSGTTVLAAQKTGRIAYGIELDPHYVDVIVRRWIASGGATPRLAETGQTFEEVAAERPGTEAHNQDTPTPTTSSAEACRG